MELHASGFNAWRQLDFSEARLEDEPTDLFAFTRLLQGRIIERPVASLHHTIVRVDERLLQAGFGSQGSDELEREYSSVTTASGLVYTTKNDLLTAAAVKEGAPKPGLWQYPNGFTAEGREEPRYYPSDSPVQQIAAFDVGVVILYQDGSVGTMGDGRFEDCLGREVTDDSPADRPGRVTDLDDLGEPVKQVAAGGYTIAALTKGGSLYVWGMRTTGTHRRRQAFESLGGVPNYMEVDGGKDVQDVAVGESHALALTTDGYVYGIGDNQNGQLGLGEAFGGRTEQWVKLGFVPPDHHCIVGVAAGPRCSFIMTSNMGVPEHQG